MKKLLACLLLPLLAATSMAAPKADKPAPTTVKTKKAASFAEFDRRARAGEPLSVVFFGGSLTYCANASNPDVTGWRGLVADHLRKKYPKAPFTFHDAAIGGSGSLLGQFRLQRDVLDKNPDLVFFEWMVNDGYDSDALEPTASYEGMLRKLIGAGIPVVQEFMIFKWFKAPEAYKFPRYLIHWELSRAYHTAPADVMRYVIEFQEKNPKTADGKSMNEHIWPADGAHPYDFGYQLFFEAIRDAFDKAVKEKVVCVVPEKPVYSDKFNKTTRYVLSRELAADKLPLGWKKWTTYRTSLWYDGLTSRWMDDVLCGGGRETKKKTDIAPEKVDPLKVEFTGTLVGIFYERAGNSLDFTVKIDGKPVLFEDKHAGVKPQENWPTNLKARFAPGFDGAHLFGWLVLADKLEPGKHTLEIQPILDPANPDGSLHIESICSAGE